MGREGSPRAVGREVQEDAWYFGTDRVGPAASAAQAGWNQFPPDHPPKLDVVDRATWDVQARLARMDEYGIWAQVLYPNVAGFGAGKVLAIGDAELMLACVRAYNDFLTDFASADPRRLIPIAALPFWDMELTANEIARCVENGHKGVIMTGEPAHWGMPKLADPYWDKLWAVAQDAGLSINFHIGSGDMSIFDTAYNGAGKHANYAGFGVQFGMANVRVIANLITGGRVPPLPGPQIRLRGERYRLDTVRSRPPRLAVEELRRPRGASGIRSLAERVFQPPDVRLLLVRRADRQGGHRPVWSGLDSLRERLPAPTSMTPGPATAAVAPREYIANTLGEIPEDVLRKILHDNAATLYHMD